MDGEPIRGGTRGGSGNFSWAAVKEDRHREYYLGHSVNAAQGRWQKNKDIHWYNRDRDDDDENMKRDEIIRIKEAENEALNLALGIQPAPEDPQQEEKKIKEKAQKLAEKRFRKEERDRVRRERDERRKQRSDKHSREYSPQRRHKDERYIDESYKDDRYKDDYYKDHHRDHYHKRNR